MEVTKQLFFNLSILLVFLFFLQLRIDRKVNIESSKPLMFTYFAAAVFICMLLSVETDADIRFDLRQVPIIVGTLYLGWWAGISFYAATIIFRAFLGINLGLWVCAVVYGIQAIVLLFLHHSFLMKYKSFGRVAISILISIFSSITLITILDLLGKPIDSKNLLISFILLPALGSGLMTYTIENWMKNREIQKQLWRSEKLENISHLSSALAHEIRNPMTAVKGFLQLIVSDAFDEKKKKEYALIAVSEIDRAEKIIRDFLTYAKPHLNEKHKISLPEEIYKTLELIEPLAHLNTVEILFDSRSSSFVFGEESLIHQCLLNLFKNSIEAMENGGTLSILTYQDDSNLYVDIKDTGIGMSEMQIKLLGKPFFSTKGEKGTGLGMMTTISLLKSMNGSLKVTSQLGEGTTFTLSFPLLETSNSAELPLKQHII